MGVGIVQLTADHPGFHDLVYRQRRDEIAALALTLTPQDTAPRIAYTPTETATWGTVVRELVKLYPTHACHQFNASFRQTGFTADAIPQHADVSAFLQAKTGFRVLPVAGLLEPRDFLGLLAQRVFPATQYIRHHSAPHYTPEPDVCHELLGHVPMLGVAEYAELSAQFGVYSLHATDAQIAQLSRLYWYTVEFGVLREGAGIRAYGSGHLSSFGELARVIRGEGVELRDFDPEQAALAPYDPTRMQPILYVVDSIREAFELCCSTAERLLKR